MITLTILSPEDWRLFRLLRLEALRDAPYAFGSTLRNWQGPRDLECNWRSRLTDVPHNLIARLDGVPAGMVSALDPDNENAVELISMWVAPFARGRGVGDALINAVTSWARGRDASRVVLAVREQNERAIALYRRMGFVYGKAALDAGEVLMEYVVSVREASESG